MYIEELKFSLWADFIERDYLDGEFRELIRDGVVNGATSNPAIFKNAILNSLAYKEQLESLDGLDAKEKYEAVAIYDIQKASDILKPLYDKGDDGYVSIEVDPFLCDDADATISEGKRLYKAIDRQNVMIKIPATDAGYKAMKELVACGIAVNATLVFSKKQAIACAEAFRDGLQKTDKKVDTVISVFVSRIDRALDKKLKECNIATSLTGIYNSADIYEVIEKMKVKNCRVLFASTGVKDDTLKGDYYIENLLAYNSINTAPIDTIKSFCKNSTSKAALPIPQDVIREHFKKIKDAGIDFEELIASQISDGLEAFKKAFKDILEKI